MRLAKEGLPFVVIPLAAGLVLFKVSAPLGLGAASAAIFFAFFFRDPARRIRLSAGAVLSPADGRVTEATAGKVSIYLSLFDAHVNRSPVSGVVSAVIYSPGAFRPAGEPEAAMENENNLIEITGGGIKVSVRQIAGKFARRIVCYCEEGGAVRQGEKIGMIKFGSRVEVSFPEDAAMLVKAGEKVRAGETLLAVLR